MSDAALNQQLRGNHDESGYFDTYCPDCDVAVRAPLLNKPARHMVRGQEVAYIETVAQCPHCGEVIGDARIEGENLERAYAVYRENNGILSPGEIKELRLSFGLSLREFSRFLGFGEQTVYRYERGDLPDLPHNTTMLIAASPDGAQSLLNQNKTRLLPDSVAKVERYIESRDGKASRALTLAGSH